MKYKLALDLKNAGFPKGVDGWCIDHGNEKHPNETLCKYPYAPTLDELIEACGLGLVAINRDSPDTWIAVGQTKGGLLKEEGKTPEEAVAKLWIALNPKKKSRK